MQIVFHRNFRRAYARLMSEHRDAVDATIERFRVEGAYVTVIMLMVGKHERVYK